jgi:uncharacterized protein YbdZ (MbtH family)
MEEPDAYRVVSNHEEQYSIWPADQELPLGWVDAGKAGTKEECLSYINEVWTDMRPLSLRRWMEAEASRAAQEPPPAGASDEGAPEQASDLVTRLSQGEHPVEANLRPERTALALKERIEQGYFPLKFTDTFGGTELGVRLDPGGVDVSGADFDNQSGTVHLEGGLTLNYVKVRCVADLNLQTLTGKGHLVPVSEGSS